MLLVSLPTSSQLMTKKILSSVEGLEHVEVSGIKQIAELYRQGHGIVGICASGILIRAVAGEIGNKKSDPPLISIADDGSVVVPLLGGHHGANKWARDIAKATGAFPAITTASDVTLKFDFENPPTSLKLISDGGAHKSAVARLLKGAGLKLIIDCELTKSAHTYIATMPKPINIEDEVFVYVGHQPPVEVDLVYVPKTTVLGVGASRNCPPDELKDLALSCLTEANLHPASVVTVCSHKVKHDEVAVLDLAKFFGVEPSFYDSETLNQHKDKLSRTSEIVFREVGVWGVAEAAALESVSKGSAKPNRLSLPKQKTAMATCAIAIRQD